MTDGTEWTAETLAEPVRAALESEDLAAFGALLSPDVQWGAPGDTTPDPKGCATSGATRTGPVRSLFLPFDLESERGRRRSNYTGPAVRMAREARLRGGTRSCAPG